MALDLNLTAVCLASIFEHSILMKDNEPAGQELLNTDILRISVVQNEFPPSFQTDEMQSWLERGGRPHAEQPDSFPEGIEEAVQHAVGYWHQGEIEFVGLNEDHDLQIVAIQNQSPAQAGYATFPLNDSLDPKEIGNSNPTIIVNMTSVRTEVQERYEPSELKAVEDIVRHEVGHNIGIFHPSLGGMEGEENLPMDVCIREEKRDLSFSFRTSVMVPLNRIDAAPGFGETISVHDEFLRDVIQGGIPPSKFKFP